MKRGTVIKPDKAKMRDRRKQVVFFLSHQNSERILTGVTNKRSKLLKWQALEERGGEFSQRLGYEVTSSSSNRQPEISPLGAAN